MTEHEIKELEQRLRVVETQQAKYSGRDTVRWEQQSTVNQQTKQEFCRTRDKIGLIFKKLATLETKVALFAAGAALFGTAIAKYLLP